MKKFKYSLIALAALSMASCDPMEDVYNELDADKLPLNNSVTYSLISEDYKALSAKALEIADTKEDSVMARNILKQQAFNDTFTPSQLVPGLIASKYYHLGFTSKAMVTYNVTTDVSKNVIKLEGLEAQPLTNEDYQIVMGTGSDVNFFSPNKPADPKLLDIMASKYANINNDTVMHIQYANSATEPSKDVTEVSYISQDLEAYADYDTEISGWNNDATEGEKLWQVRSYSGNKYLQFSAFNAPGATVAWFISPATTIAEGSAPKFGFDLKIRNNTQNHEALSVMISTDYTGDINAAKWENISAELNLPVGETNDAFVKIENIDFSRYAGQKINIAFVYNGNGTTNQTATYQLDNFRLSERKEAYINPLSIVDVLVEKYKGKWAFYKFGHVVSADEYKQMGANTSFKDQATADAMLPILLKQVYTFIKEGDTRTIVYKVSSNTFVDEYTYTNGLFVKNNWIEEKTEQYVRNEKEWIFDPSISFTVDNADYTTIVKWVKDNKPAYMDPSYDNSEYYFGASYKYNNFNHTPVKLTDADNRGDKEFEGKDMAVVMKERMSKCFAEVLLPAKYADATPLNGIDTYYTVSYLVYDGANTNFSMKFKLTGKGQFEYVEGPTQL